VNSFFIRLEALPPVEKRADLVSRYIFHHYLAQMPRAPWVDHRLLQRKKIRDESPCFRHHEPATFGEFISTIAKMPVQLLSNFEPDASVNMTFGLAAQGLRLFHLDLKAQKKKLIEIVKEIESKAYRDQGRVYWPHFIRNPKGDYLPFINLGLPKGIGGVISFLSLCYSENIERARCRKLIDGAIKTLLWIDQESHELGLPAGWGYSPYEKKHSMSWMYGDLTVGYVLALAGHRCQNQAWMQAGEKIFLRGLQPPHLEKIIRVCNFMFGGAGLAHLAFRFHQLTGNREALLASKIWLERTNQRYIRVAQKKELQEFRKHPEITPSLLNSSLGLYLVNWHHEGFIDARWDSIYGLSNPVSQAII
jgi:hypothetical protein